MPQWMGVVVLGSTAEVVERVLGDIDFAAQLATAYDGKRPSVAWAAIDQLMPRLDLFAAFGATPVVHGAPTPRPDSVHLWLVLDTPAERFARAWEATAGRLRDRGFYTEQFPDPVLPYLEPLGGPWTDEALAEAGAGWSRRLYDAFVWTS